jgi:hypothetical protein
MTPNEEPLTAAGARSVLSSADTDARALQVKTHWIFVTWGAAWLIGCLARQDIPVGAIGILSCVVPALLVATIYVASAGTLMQPAFLVSGICFAVSAVVGAGADPATAALVIGVGGAAGCAAGAVMAGVSARP